MSASLKIKRALVRQVVEPSAEQHSRYRTRSVSVPWSSNDNPGGNFRVSVNIDHKVIDGWLHDNDGFFEAQHIKVFAHCADLWNNCPGPRQFEHGGAAHTAALRTLADFKGKVPRYAWEIFENVCRWDEPTGIPGSRYSTARPSSVRAAKHVVRYVAEELFR